MARRRSARLASAAKPAPTSALESVAEMEEKSSSPLKPKANSSAPAHPPSSPHPHPRTPASSVIKPPMSEMHPALVHPTTAPPSQALHLGFSDIKPNNYLNSSPTVALTDRLAASATKPRRPPSSSFTFRVDHTGDVSGSSLSARAQRMMDEIREDARKIKEDLAAKREREREAEDDEENGRRIAQPKGKRGRFSAAHMAEFKKMDSIENHPSAFRAQQSYSNDNASKSALTKGIKRTQSKANLNESEPAAAATATTPLNRGLKRTQSKVNLNEPESASARPTSRHQFLPSAKKPALAQEPASAVKRARKHIDEDVSTNRPSSRDASHIPRPATSGKDAPTGIQRPHNPLASLMTPTKASMAKSTVSQSIRKSASSTNLASASKLPSEAWTPNRLDRVKSLLRGQNAGADKSKSGLPMPASTSLAAGFKTPVGPQSSLNKPLPQVPAATPSSKIAKRVLFTPDGKKAVPPTVVQGTPSPIKSILKSGIPRSKTMSDLKQVHYPKLVGLEDEEMEDVEPEIRYPTLTTPKLDRHLKRSSPPLPGAETAAPGVPGTFTFRSDHTIKFNGTSPEGFGASRGQASVRGVRQSTMPANGPVMPGSFPSSVFEFTDGGNGTTSQRDNKENRAPLLPAIKHGLKNKKRHRVSSDNEDEDDFGPRTAKKRRCEPAPDGHAIVAPRLAGGSASVPPSARKPQSSGLLFNSPKKPSQIPGIGAQTPNSSKKKSGISLSRLQMLARPKMRK